MKLQEIVLASFTSLMVHVDDLVEAGAEQSRDPVSRRSRGFMRIPSGACWGVHASLS